MWETLEAIGLPDQFIKAVQMFYANNKHFMKICGSTIESITVRSGVRQGRPLSPLLFALCADILLREISAVLAGDDVARAFADDTAVVVEDFKKTLPELQVLFREFEEISALSLNIDKTVFIPLWPSDSFDDVRVQIQLACPAWSNLSVRYSGKYLGFVIGPGAGSASWTKPLDKFASRAREWASLNLGLFYNTA